MFSSVTVFDRRRLLLLAVLGLAGCGEDPSTPYLEYAGGGFVFNYRTANHYYGFVVRQKRPLPEGGRLEVRFELPGGQEEKAAEKIVPGRLQYKFQTGDIDGIEANHPYKAVLVLLDAEGKEIERLEHSFKTDVEQSSLPAKPLVVGPGYQPNPDQPD